MGDPLPRKDTEARVLGPNRTWQGAALPRSCFRPCLIQARKGLRGKGPREFQVAQGENLIDFLWILFKTCWPLERNPMCLEGSCPSAGLVSRGYMGRNASLDARCSKELSHTFQEKSRVFLRKADFFPPWRFIGASLWEEARREVNLCRWATIRLRCKKCITGRGSDLGRRSLVHT